MEIVAAVNYTYSFQNTQPICHNSNVRLNKEVLEHFFLPHKLIIFFLLCFLPAALVRRGVLRVSLTGRYSAALDRLSEEQGEEGGALAHSDQRAAGVHAAGLNRASSPVMTLERLLETFHRMR